MNGYHIITPLTRFSNIPELLSLLGKNKVHWHFIIDDVLPYEVSAKPEFDWVHFYRFPHREKAEGIDPCLVRLNWWLELGLLIDDDRYIFLNDDDGFEPFFFEKIRAQEGHVLVCSMARGHRTPLGVEPHRAHGTHSLIAAKENMVPCRVSLEQIIISGKVLKTFRFSELYGGDGEFIKAITEANDTVYMPDTFTWFNYLEPNRWDKYT